MALEIPQLPTDNLYKFMALSGLCIAFVCLLPQYHIYRLNLDIVHLEGEENRYRNEMKLETDIIGDKVKFLDRYKDDKKAELDEAMSLKTELYELERKENLARVNIDNILAEKKYILSVIKKEVIGSFIGLPVGTFMALFGFILWYKKLQAPQDKLLQQQLKQKIV